MKDPDPLRRFIRFATHLDGGTSVEVCTTIWRVHTAVEKAAALQDRETLGTTAAAAKHGVSVQTLRNWVREAAEASKAAEGIAEESNHDGDACREAGIDPVDAEPVDPATWETWLRVHRELDRLHSRLFTCRGGSFIQRTELTSLQQRYFKAMGAMPPPRFESIRPTARRRGRNPL